MDAVIYTLAHGFGAHDAALAVLRACVGAFFAISGFHKLFNKARHARLRSTLEEDKVPAVWFMQWWVPFWEFTAGVMLTIGLLTAFSAGVLIIICLVACFCEAPSKVARFGPINWADKLDDYLYLPEVLYIIMLSVNVLSGTGKYSVDYFIF